MLEHAPYVLAFLYGLGLVVLVSNLLLLRRRTSIPSTERPSVSVLIPARNEEANLRRLLPSLLQQRYRDFEIVIFDIIRVLDAGPEDDVLGQAARKGSFERSWLDVRIPVIMIFAFVFRPLISLVRIRAHLDRWHL